MSDSFEVEGADVVFRSHVFDVERRTIRHGKTKFRRDVAVHPGAVAILPINAAGEVGFIRQYRSTFDEFLLEIPAGTRDIPDEEPLETAKRELLEEMGFEAKEWTLLGRFMNSPGWTTQVMIDLRGARSDPGRASARRTRRTQFDDPLAGARRDSRGVRERLGRLIRRRPSRCTGSSGRSLTSPSAALEEYLQWLTIEKGRSRATIEAYRRDLRRCWTWARERGATISDVSEEELERYFNEAATVALSASTVARAVAAARGFFAYLVDEGYLVTDPSGPTEGRSARTDASQASR